MNFFKMDSFIYIFIFGLFIPFCFSLEGPNICEKEEERLTTVNVPAKIPVETKTIKWCWSFYPRCRKKVIEFRDGYKTETKLQKVIVKACCKGFVEIRDRCIPICSNACIHGICIAPETCECQPGWGGSTCNVWHTCPEGKKGPMCNDTCDCKNGAKCDPTFGHCTCTPGWTGHDCGTPCPPNKYGFQCIQECKCKNNAQCDHITGKCKCHIGFKGEYCEDICKPSDEDCSNPCLCKNGGLCDENSGHCICKAGFTGMYCSEICPLGTFGLDCLERCDCNFTTQYCDHVKGCVHKPLLAHHAQELYYEEEANNSSVVIAICSAFLVILAALLLLLAFYRRKLKKLSEDFAYVTYAAKKDPTDRFDNPVYAYQTSNINKLAPEVQNNSKFHCIKNDLSFCKNNIEKANFSGTDFDSNFGACCNDNSLSTKLHGLDYNPNIYINSDECKSLSDKKEPLYDEIKCKSSEEDISEDHYDRPRPHSKMNNYESIDALNKC